MEKNNQANKSTDEEDDPEDVEHAPKITRSKAKVLNKIILPITSPSEPSEASILIQQELRSDDEDEEYEPGNEDVHVRCLCTKCGSFSVECIKRYSSYSQTMNIIHPCRIWTRNHEHREPHTLPKKTHQPNTPTMVYSKYQKI